MVYYNIAIIELQLALRRVADQAQTVETASEGLGDENVKPSFGSHAEVAGLSTVWTGLMDEVFEGSSRLSGSIYRKTQAVTEAASIFEKGDAQKADDARQATAKISDHYGF